MWQHLGEAVSDHLVGQAVVELHKLCLDHVVDPVPLDVDVLCVLVEHIIACKGK